MRGLRARFVRGKGVYKITISCGKNRHVTRLMAVMGLGIKQGQTVTVTIDGSDEGQGV